MEYILWRYRNLSAIVHATWRRPKHGGDQKLAGICNFFVFVKYDYIMIIVFEFYYYYSLFVFFFLY